MNTPTHFLMTAAIRRALPTLQISRSAAFLGSVAPDLPLYVLCLSGLLFYRYVAGWSLPEAADWIFGTLYFEHPLWIGLHNFLHSPLNLSILLVLISFAVRSAAWRWWWLWFLCSCMLHSVVDIFTHYDDGPLLLWPLNWHLRFHSPVSYWDHRHFGSEASRFELLLVICLAGYLVWPRIAKLLGSGKGRASSHRGEDGK